MNLVHLLLTTTIIIFSWPSATTLSTTTASPTPEPSAATNPPSTSAAPIARDDVGSTYEDSPVTTSVLLNDEDPEDPKSTLSINEIPGLPTYGAVTTDGTGITYSPTGGYARCAAIAGQADEFTDTYQYNIIVVGDGVVSNDATVTITVQCYRAAPNAYDDQAQTDTQTAICIDVLDNDTDPEGDTNGLIIKSITQPPAGTAAQVTGCNGIQYDPPPSSNALCNGVSSYTDTFTYIIKDSDDELEDDATVTITIDCPREVP